MTPNRVANFTRFFRPTAYSIVLAQKLALHFANAGG